MQIDKQQIVHMLRDGGEDDKAADMARRLPDPLDGGHTQVCLAAALSSIRSGRKPAHTCVPSACTCDDV
jgi:hypothetical protein